MYTLSIGIPTYERLDLLKRLLDSIITQEEISHINIEILIGDDSKKNIYHQLTELYRSLPDNVILDYQHHQPSKGQNDNVASLINRAKGNFFCLMHDDDYFLNGTLKKLIDEAEANSNCIIFGKQLLLLKEFDFKLSETINGDFKRNSSFAGKQKDSVEMAMRQQCPNDGFILQTLIAKKIGYRPSNIIGTACDFDFALRAAIVEKLDFLFLDHYTTVYSITDESVTTSFENNAGERKLKILYEYKTDKTHPQVFQEILKSDLSMVISYYIDTRQYREAKNYLFSFKNMVNYLWYKPVTYLQLLKVLSN